MGNLMRRREQQTKGVLELEDDTKKSWQASFTHTSLHITHLQKVEHDELAHAKLPLQHEWKQIV
jgi:hypothetical protein